MTMKKYIGILCKKHNKELRKKRSLNSVRLLTMFLFDEKVDLEESPLIANAENVRVVPTIKIYKKGNRVKEMVCPSPEVLEASLRHYSF